MSTDYSPAARLRAINITRPSKIEAYEKFLCEHAYDGHESLEKLANDVSGMLSSKLVLPAQEVTFSSRFPLKTDLPTAYRRPDGPEALFTLCGQVLAAWISEKCKLADQPDVACSVTFADWRSIDVKLKVAYL